MTVKESVEYLNGLHLEQKYGLDEDLSPADIAATGIDDDNIIAEELDPVEHRWYVTSTTVYKVNGGFIGCRLVSMMKTENSDISDICHEYEFMEMEEIVGVTTYAVKK